MASFPPLGHNCYCDDLDAASCFGLSEINHFGESFSVASLKSVFGRFDGSLQFEHPESCSAGLFAMACVVGPGGDCRFDLSFCLGFSVGGHLKIPFGKLGLMY